MSARAPGLLRVVSYNIHKGFDMRNQGFVLEGIREAVRTVSPDLVCLQEVLGQHEGFRQKIATWPQKSQFEFMAESLWPHFAYGRNAVYSEGHHGNAILSRFPIESWENEDISVGRVERRGLLHVVLRPDPLRPRLHLICTHFGLSERHRRLQARRLCQRVIREVGDEDGLVVAGDFNDWRQKLTPLFEAVGLHEAFRDRYRRHARTFPAWWPLLPLDRIYVRGLRAELILCLRGKPWVSLSDHAPLLAEFFWEDPEDQVSLKT